MRCSARGVACCGGVDQGIIAVSVADEFETFVILEPGFDDLGKVGG